MLSTWLGETQTSAEPDSPNAVRSPLFISRITDYWQREQPEAHWLVPVKGNTKYRVVKTFGEGDHLVEIQVSPQARKQDDRLPEVWQMRLIKYDEGSDYKGFITSLTEVCSPAASLR